MKQVVQASKWVLTVAVGTLGLSLVAQDPGATPAESASGAAPAGKGQSTRARAISARNGFGLADPTPPPVVVPPEPPAPPPTPPSNVQLTGFSRWAGERKVYLIVTKQGAKAPEYFDLREGDERSDIRVLEIDETREIAKIMNTGVEQTLNFKDNGAKPGAGGGPVQAGMPAPPPGTPGFVPPPPVVQGNRFGNAGPTVVGRGGEVGQFNPGGGLVTDGGGNTTINLGQTQPNGGVSQNGGVIVGGNSGVIPIQSANPNSNPSPGAGQNRPRVFNIPPPPLPIQ